MPLNKEIVLSTLKNKFVFISSIALLAFIIFGVFTTYSLVQLNMEVEKLFNLSELRTRAIFQAHDSISNMESFSKICSRSSAKSGLKTAIIKNKLRNFDTAL